MEVAATEIDEGKAKSMERGGGRGGVGDGALKISLGRRFECG
jgi:hypothetical protein